MGKNHRPGHADLIGARRKNEGLWSNCEKTPEGAGRTWRALIVQVADIA